MVYQAYGDTVDWCAILLSRQYPGRGQTQDEVAVEQLILMLKRRSLDGEKLTGTMNMWPTARA